MADTRCLPGEMLWCPAELGPYKLFLGLDHEGWSQFFQLMRKRKTVDVTFYAFDLLWLDGVDLRPLELTHRKRVLRYTLNTNKFPSVTYAEHVEGMGIGLFKEVMTLEFLQHHFA